jgi:hypothetical protein
LVGVGGGSTGGGAVIATLVGWGESLNTFMLAQADKLAAAATMHMVRTIMFISQFPPFNLPRNIKAVARL